MLVNREELYKRIENFMDEDDYYGEWEDYITLYNNVVEVR